MPAPKRPDQQSILDQLAPYVQPKQVNNNVGIGKYYNSAELLLRSVSVVISTPHRRCCVCSSNLRRNWAKDAWRPLPLNPAALQVEVSRVSNSPDALRHIYVYLMRYAR